MAEQGSVSHIEFEHLEHSHPGRYLAVWIALLSFTILTWGLSRLHIPGGWGVLVALTIAATKGSLVVLFFMHLWDQRGANRLVFLTTIVFVALMAGLIILDNATRFPLANPPGSDVAPVRPGGAPAPPELPAR